MAIAPLFVADLATLKARLRMTGASESDALSQFDGAVEDVRLLLYDETQGLGLALVTTLLAIVFVENATTAEALKRTRANSLETKWVRLLLLRRMPTLFMDASAVTREAWNDEPFTRSGGRTLRDEISAIETQIKNDLAVLLGDTGEIGMISVILAEADDAADLPFDSIAPLSIDT